MHDPARTIPLAVYALSSDRHTGGMYKTQTEGGNRHTKRGVCASTKKRDLQGLAGGWKRRMVQHGTRITRTAPCNMQHVPSFPKQHVA